MLITSQFLLYGYLTEHKLHACVHTHIWKQRTRNKDLGV